MVHRSPDSRLLVNLLQNEKEYAKHLNNLQDLSNNSLASFAAYAAASSQPTSQVILSVAGSLAAADEALRRYVLGVDDWRDSMRGLKELEEEVGNIIRDREILVTRVIKASRSGKNAAGNIRDSLLLGHQTFTSASSLSLTSSPQDSPSPGASRPLSAAFSISIPTSTKLAAAQAELQACEIHLATKEQELATRRCTALKDGLRARMSAMAECGWAWNEIGKEATRTLDDLAVPHSRGDSSHDANLHDSRTSSPLVQNSLFAAPPVHELNGARYTVPEPRMSHYMVAHEQQHQPMLHYPSAPEIMESPMSGFSSLGPSQSAQMNQPQQQQGAPSILSLVDPGVAFGASKVAFPLGAAVQIQGPARESEVDDYQLADEGEQEREEEKGHVSDEQPTHTNENDDTLLPAPVTAPATVLNTTPHSASPPTADRPPSNASSNASSMYYTPATPTTYKTETISYAPAIAVHAVPSKEGQPSTQDRTQGIGEGDAEGESEAGMPPPVQFQMPSQSSSQSQHQSQHQPQIQSQHHTQHQPHEVSFVRISTSTAEPVSPYAPLTRKEYFEEDLHKSVRIPPAHAIGEYEMPLATPPVHEQLHQGQQPPNASPAKRNSLLMRLGSLGGGSNRSSSPSSAAPSAPHTPVLGDPQVDSGVFARHVLERRITEEEMRGGQPLLVQPHQPQSQQQPQQTAESDEESDDRWLGDGELRVVENPRFMSEERKRELARKKDKEEEEQRGRAMKDKGKGKEKMKEGGEDDDGGEHDTTPKARNRRISFVKHNKGAESQSTVDAGPGGTSPGKHTQGSPSKGFLGSIKGLFTTKLAAGSSTSPTSKKGVHRRTKSEVVSAKEEEVVESDSDDDSGVVERSPTKSSGFHLFGGGKKKGGVKERKWETRTDRNLRKLEAAASKGPLGGGGTRKFSLDESRAVPVVVEGGGVERVMRAAAVVANGSNASLLSDAKNERDRKKLRKTRGGPVEVVVGGSQQLPLQPEGTGIATGIRRHPSQVTKLQQPKTGLTHRRSASIDVGVQQRRTFAENEARRTTNVENEMRRGNSGGDGGKVFADAESDHGTLNGIVDLGMRRRAASEVGRGVDREGVPQVPSRQPVPMGYVPTAPGSVLGGVRVGEEPSRPIQVQQYVRPERTEVGSASGGATTQRKTSILKTRKASSDVGPPTTNAYSLPAQTQPAPPPPIQAQISSSPPLSRRPSTRTVPTNNGQSYSAAAPTKQPTTIPPAKPSSSSLGRATVLPAGGDHPSGTLVAYSGWYGQQQSGLTTTGGSVGGGAPLSRNTSVKSSASAPSGEGQGVPQSRGVNAKRQKQSVLGQGMPPTTMGGGGVGRHASLGHASGGGLLAQQRQHQQQHYQQPQHQHSAPAQSLLKIVEDVAKVNKKGPMTGGIGIPSAPPRVLTEKLKTMDQDVFRSKVGASPTAAQSATHGTKTKSATTAPASYGLWEIKAPASVWDQRQALMEQHVPPSKHSGMYKESSSSMSAPDLSLTSVARARSLTTPKSDVGGGNLSNGYATGAHPAKSPLRSAMRHPSRTPSPLVSGSPHIRAGSGPASSASYSSPLTRHEPLAGSTASPQHRPSPLVRDVEKRKDKGKGRAIEEPEDGAESSAYETGNEAFYTDEESGAESKGRKPILAAPVPYSGPSHMNGHATGYAEYMKGASDVSRSDTSGGTAHATPSTSDHQQPRRRKSVRVSLKPTFSPSPPAIEYDNYEEASRHAPWAWEPKASSSKYDSIEKRASESVPQAPSGSHYNHDIASPTPQAPARQHTIVKQQKDDRTKDIWEDSSDDDEAYFKAKQALSEAAKFEKDVTLMVANRRF